MRVWILVLALGVLSWFQFGQVSSAAALAQRAVDVADSRPPRAILILGNSRTFYNDMPAMLRKIADSAGSPTKFQIETSAEPGFTLEKHWSHGRSRALLDDTWDEIIFQGESGAQSSVEQSESFKAYGRKLALLARVQSGQATLLINWPYDPSVFAGYEPYDRAEHLSFLKSVHADLAQEAQLDRINLASLWESVRLSHPEIGLTTDGNHPTVAGSYLYALALYRSLSGEPVSRVSYAPAGLKPSDALALRQAVDSFPLLTG